METVMVLSELLERKKKKISKNIFQFLLFCFKKDSHTALYGHKGE